MSTGIVIYKSPLISLDEWRNLISSDNSLRLRLDPYSACNPKSGERITIPAGEADTEIQVMGQWEPFLHWRRGSLTMKYMPEFETPSNPIRCKLVQVAKKLHAVLGTDVSDEALGW